MFLAITTVITTGLRLITTGKNTAFDGENTCSMVETGNPKPFFQAFGAAASRVGKRIYFFFFLIALWSRHVKPSSAKGEKRLKREKIPKFVQAEALPESKSCTSLRIAVQPRKTESRETEKYSATRNPHSKPQSILNSSRCISRVCVFFFFWWSKPQRHLQATS